jgi:hypothetical protein
MKENLEKMQKKNQHNKRGFLGLNSSLRKGQRKNGQFISQ